MPLFSYNRFEMTRLLLDYFGSFKVTSDTKPVSRFRSVNVQGLLVYLSLQPGRAIPRESLTTLFWPEEVEAKGKANLRQSIYQLRNVLNDRETDINKVAEEPILLVNRQTVTFNEACDYRLDVAGFLAALETANYVDALGLYSGDLLPGFSCDSLEFEAWLSKERASYHRKAVAAATALIDLYFSAADFDGAEAAARRLLGMEPLFEHGLRQLMRALALGGDRRGALAAYAQYTTDLQQEIGPGAVPEPETATLAQKIAAGVLELPPRSISVLPTLDKVKVLSRLDPLPDQKLFGIERPRQTVIEVLKTKDRPWLVAIDGIGGIGKSSLANAVVHHFLEEEPTRFGDIAWVSAKQEEYLNDGGIRSTGKPALDATALIDQLLIQLIDDAPYPTAGYAAKETALLDVLNKKPTLVVIDNLETVDDYKALLPTLRKLSRPSKFLLTSRMSLQTESDVRCLSLTELGLDDVIPFLKFEIDQQAILSLKSVGKPALEKIYETVGGNPLALKLVLGQAHLMSPDTILANIARAETSSVEQLYRYIYWQAWEMLDEVGRQLWISMPIVPNGTFDQLIVASRLSPAACQQGLTLLRRLSLIEIGEMGEDQTPRYRIHRLTETFLLHEVLKWQAAQQAAIPESNRERTLFELQISGMLDYWRNDSALAAIDAAKLDKEKAGILKVIHFGLDSDSFWPIVKDLILALTSYMERRGHWDEWRQTLERAIEVAQHERDMDGALAISNRRGRILQLQNKHQAVIENYWAVIRMARAAQNRVEMGRALSNLGYALIKQNQWWRSESVLCAALKIFEEEQFSHGLAHTHNHLGLLFLHQGLYRQAELNLRKGCEIWNERGDRYGLIKGVGNLGYLYNEMEKPETAKTYLEQAVSQIKELGDSGELPSVLHNLSTTYLLLGDLETAKAYGKRAEELYQKNQNLREIYLVWENFAQIFAQEKNLEEAQSYFDAAESGYSRLKMRDELLRIMARKVMFFVDVGDSNKARKILDSLKREVESYSFFKRTRYYQQAIALF